MSLAALHLATRDQGAERQPSAASATTPVAHQSPSFPSSDAADTDGAFVGPMPAYNFNLGDNK